MYNPCLECFNKYGKQYSEKCDATCDYANLVSKLKPYGGIDEVIKMLSGDAFPLVYIDKDHINFTYRLVSAAKNGFI